MEEYKRFILYTFIAIAGAIAHYLKKRYIDSTLGIGLKSYIYTNRKATFNALCACATVAYGYAIVDGDIFSLSTIAGVLSGGYVADSGLNSATSEDKCCTE